MFFFRFIYQSHLLKNSFQIHSAMKSTCFHTSKKSAKIKPLYAVHVFGHGIFGVGAALHACVRLLLVCSLRLVLSVGGGVRVLLRFDLTKNASIRTEYLLLIAWNTHTQVSYLTRLADVQRCFDYLHN